MPNDFNGKVQFLLILFDLASSLKWKSFTLPGTKVAFSLFMWGVFFTACVTFFPIFKSRDNNIGNTERKG